MQAWFDQMLLSIDPVLTVHSILTRSSLSSDSKKASVEVSQLHGRIARDLPESHE